MFALYHRFIQFLLVFGQKSMNLAVGFVTYRVNPGCKILAPSVRILIEHRLNFVVVFLQQAPDLWLLFRG